MAGPEFKPGDMVTYRDRDRLKWGPWEVVNTAGNHVTVAVEDKIEYSVNAALLQKIGHDKERV